MTATLLGSTFATPVGRASRQRRGCTVRDEAAEPRSSYELGELGWKAIQQSTIIVGFTKCGVNVKEADASCEQEEDDELQASIDEVIDSLEKLNANDSNSITENEDFIDIVLEKVAQK